MSLNCDNGPLARPTIKHIPQLKSTSYYRLATLETLFIKRRLPAYYDHNIIVNPLEIKTCYLIVSWMHVLSFQQCKNVTA